MRSSFARLTGLLWLCLAAIISGPGAPRAEDAKVLKGVALVIGNSDYEHVARLPNPANDARGIEEMLDGLGFETTVSLDRDARRLKRDLEGFVEDAQGADVAVLYYSGHGIEAGGENFLVPVDADLSALDNATEKLAPLSAVLDSLKAAVPVAMVLLDACRTSPFPAGTSVSDGQAAGVSTIGTGLGVPRGASSLSSPADAKEDFGTVIGFAAEPGRAALDGPAGSNSPYAAALLKHLSAMKGEEFGTVMRMVAEEVYLKTGGKQRPWMNESLRRLLYFGAEPQSPTGEEGDILSERRNLLLTIAALPEAGRRQIETIAQSRGVPMDALYGMLAALGAEAPKDPAELDGLLRTQTERLKQILAERDALKSADPEITRLTALADRALAEGALTASIRILGEAKARVATLGSSVDQAESEIRAKRIEFAAVYARSAQAHALAFDFLSAADDYALAFGQVEKWDDRLAWTYRNGETDALTIHGNFRGDKDALVRAVRVGEYAARLARDFPDRLDWVSSQLLFGNALQALGERDAGTEHLDEAVNAYRAALDVLTPEAAPVAWAKTENNVANILATLGRRHGDPALLEESVAAYRRAIEQFLRNDARQDWAIAQSNLGKALYELADLEPGIERLNEAGRAFESALSQMPRQSAPIPWATVWNNLGNVFQNLGLRAPDANVSTGRHVQAVAAYQNALAEWTRDKVPVQWALAQNNLANAYQSLGAREKNPVIATGHFRAAEAAQRAALEEMTRGRGPLQWATLTANLARTLRMLGDTTTAEDDRAAHYAEAAARYRDALHELTSKRVPLQWAGAQASLGEVLQARAELESDPALAADYLNEAVAVQRLLAEHLAQRKKTPEWASTLHDLGYSFILLGEKGGGPDSYREAEAVYREEMTVRSRETAPVDWAKVQAGLGNALRGIGLATRDRDTLMEAKRRTEDARAAIQPFDRSYNAVLDGRIAEIDAALSGLN